MARGVNEVKEFQDLIMTIDHLEKITTIDLGQRSLPSIRGTRGSRSTFRRFDIQETKGLENLAPAIHEIPMPEIPIHGVVERRSTERIQTIH
jgi:hypothetical protein